MGNLIKCPMCEKEISPNAISCPNCGEPIKKTITSLDICNIVLINSGPAKIKVIKQIRMVTGCGLKEGKDCVDQTPAIIVKNVNISKAEEIKSSFEVLGAKIGLAPLDKILNDFITKEDLEITVKCPICNASNIKKINMDKPFFSTIFSFLSSSNLDENNECKNCGHKW